MANRNKKQQAPAQQGLSLAGWTFLVLEEDKILARGVIARTVGESHLVQFGGKPAFFRMVGNEALQEGSLFPTQEDADAFLQQYLAQFADAPTPPLIDDEFAARADANGFTLEQQAAADAAAEAAAPEAAGS